MKVKTQSKWLLNLVNGFLNVLWYANMVLIPAVFVVLTLVFITNRYTDMSTLVKHRATPAAIALPALTTQTRTITLQEDQSLIKMSVKITPGMMVLSYLLLALLEALVMTIIYNLRKLFSSFKQQQPFRHENVKYLKITALCLAFFTPLNILFGIFNYYTFTGQIKGFHEQFMMVWSDSLIGLALGAIIYIMADIFRYGFELKKENEEFV